MEQSGEEEEDGDEQSWRAGSLHAGQLDVIASLWTLARRLVPLDVLKKKLDAYVAEGHLAIEDKDGCVETFEQMQGVMRESNVYVDPSVRGAASGADAENMQMTPDELQAELDKRERQMQTLDGQEGVCTDQWRVYSEAITVLRENVTPLRLFCQASAGTGKSFLLETLYIWCCLNGHVVEACAPT